MSSATADAARMAVAIWGPRWRLGDYTLFSRISVNAFLARISGGPVVTGTFAGDRLWYGYVESVITLGAR